MHTSSPAQALYFWGRFGGGGALLRLKNRHSFLYAPTQYESHRLRQETLLKRIFSNQESPLAIESRAFLYF